jgi:RNA polymerase sigma-70 factor (ECF subfamily)
MEQDKVSDAVLVLNCQRRDKAAFRELVDRWEPRLYYYLRRIVENENDVWDVLQETWDVLQETWLAVFQNIRKLKDPMKFRTWLYQISHNKAVSLLRKKSRYTQMTEEQTADYCESNNDVSAFKEQAELVHKELEKLKLAHREVLTLHFLEGFSIQEMAQVIGISEGTVKSRLYHAKNKLYKVLKGANHV